MELYLKLGKRPKAVIRQLGYPTKNSLRAWYEEFEKRGDLVAGYVRQKPKYSDEQKSTAIEHYINHGRCFTFTIKSLGYPCGETLREWVCERHPETRKCVVGKTGQPGASLASKRAAVYEGLCTREGSAEAVDRRGWTSTGGRCTTGRTSYLAERLRCP